jgi:hypothetical protein
MEFVCGYYVFQAEQFKLIERAKKNGELYLTEKEEQDLFDKTNSYEIVSYRWRKLSTKRRQEYKAKACELQRKAHRKKIMKRLPKLFKRYLVRNVRFVIITILLIGLLLVPLTIDDMLAYITLLVCTLSTSCMCCIVCACYYVSTLMRFKPDLYGDPRSEDESARSPSIRSEE